MIYIKNTMNFLLKRLFFLFYFCIANVTGIVIQAQNIALPKFFSNGMVLQRESSVPIWGTATAGSNISIIASWDNTLISTTANANGKWSTTLKTPQAGGPYTIKVGNNIEIKSVLIGEVWVCSGQSNMKMRLGEADRWTVESDNNSNIRIFEVPVERSQTLKTDISGGFWRYGVIPDNMQHITAVGYYFARRLQLELGVPIGIIGSYEGGTNAEEWLNPTIFNQNPDIKNAYGSPSGTEAGCLYNSMIYPLFPYKISGFIWYQGENNVNRQQTYNHLMKELVKDWRKGFQNNYLPFYIVQLTSFSSDWREFREIQENISKELSNSGLAVTIDCGDQSDIHPKNKFLVGSRLGDIALSNVYGKNKSFSSPIYREMKVEGDKIRIFFDCADKGLKITSGEMPELFEIAGNDNIYQLANARIEGNTILLWSDKITTPVSARYFWKNYAVPNLYSKDDYPVAPFRTRK